ncbi:MAG TPA: hypothetical protein PK504_04775 [Ferruginibacter sp.]|nr:hypothetical protein [Ferruginibacter sp.]HRE63776.1 hypothetical protein [Ferruginibacter sp.]
MKNYLRNWNFMRFLRLAMGVFIIVQGVQTQQWLFIILGALFTLMPLLNVGCCAASGCNAPIRSGNKTMPEEINYEEVK